VMLVGGTFGSGFTYGVWPARSRPGRLHARAVLTLVPAAGAIGLLDAGGVACPGTEPGRCTDSRAAATTTLGDWHLW